MVCLAILQPRPPHHVRNYPCPQPLIVKLASYMILEFESLDMLVNLVLVSWWQCMLQGIDYYLVRLHDLRRVYSTVLRVGA